MGLCRIYIAEKISLWGSVIVYRIPTDKHPDRIPHLFRSRGSVPEQSYPQIQYPISVHNWVSLKIRKPHCRITLPIPPFRVNILHSTVIGIVLL